MFRFLIIFFLLLTACGVPGRSVDLEPLLVQQGDLPAGLTAGQVSDGSSGPGKATDFTFRIKRDIEPGGGYVSVIRFDDETALMRNFKELLRGVTVDGHPIPDLGEMAQARGNILLFTRCKALVAIQLALPAPGNLEEKVVNYGKRLDKRLKDALC